MHRGTSDNARRFCNEKHGRDLLASVEVFCRGTGWKTRSRGFWEAFATWANATKNLSAWAATGHAWAVRCRKAKYRFSPKGEAQAVQCKLIREEIRRCGLEMGTAFHVIGDEAWKASQQLLAERPWGEGVLERLAAWLGVDAAVFEEGGQAKLPLPSVVSAPQGLSSSPSPPVQPPVEPLAEAPVELPEPEQQSDCVLREQRLDTMIEQLDRLVRAGRGASHEVLRGLLVYARGQDYLAHLVDAQLQEGGR